MPTAQALLFAIMIAASSIAPVRAEILVGVPAPYTGPNAWFGEGIERGAKMALAEINTAGGLLGQEVQMIAVDDYCDGDQAVAAARKLVADGVDFVMGHYCSGAAIPASRIYAEAGILLMSPGATNPALTEQGFENVFRICGRDDQQGLMAGNYLADHWSQKNIAIVHDGQAYGQGLAEETRKALNARGVREALFAEIEPGLVDFSDIIGRIRAASVDVLYYAGYSAEAGLLVRQLRDHGQDLQFVSGDGVGVEDYWLIGGPAGEGTLFTMFQDARNLPEAADVVAALRAENFEPRGTTMLVYAAIQAWAQAVAKAGTLELGAVIQALRTNQFDTIYGTIGFDGKGDVTGYEPFAWYAWRGGDYLPVDQAGRGD